MTNPTHTQAMKVGELAKAADVSAETVRHYTRLGLINSHQDPINGYHFYNQQALKHLQFIRQAQTLGFSLNDIQNIIDQARHGDSPCPTVRDLLEQQVSKTKAKIAVLQAHLQKIEAALSTWQAMPDGVPNGDSICCLIEEWEDVNEQTQSHTSAKQPTSNGHCCGKQ
ncbi:MAG: MerR family DNA-binding protein [Pontibacterium sp.]